MQMDKLADPNLFVEAALDPAINVLHCHTLGQDSRMTLWKQTLAFVVTKCGNKRRERKYPNI